MHEVIWGNHKGFATFSGKISYYHETKRPNGANNYLDVLNHRIEVAERLIELQNKIIKL